MDVNSFNRALRSPTIKLFATIVITFCVIFFLAAFITARSARSEYEVISKRVNIAVGAIGHDLLLRAGDSISVVRPVVEKSYGVFLLEFENELVFNPTHWLRSFTEFSTKHVHECDRPAIVYGVEINPPSTALSPASRS